MYRPYLATLVLLGAGMLLAMYLAGRNARQRALEETSVQGASALRLSAAALESTIEHYRAIQSILAQSEEIRSALRSGPIAPDIRQALNLKLENVSADNPLSILYVLDRRGLAVAASNWRLPSSFVGNDYSFRPYYRGLANKDSTDFFGQGITSGEPGYFLSTAVHDDGHHFVGAVILKVELDGVERDWAGQRDIVLVTDDHGVVFLANRPDWLYRELKPLDAHQLAEYSRTRKYPLTNLKPLTLRVLQRLPQGATLVDAAMPDKPDAHYLLHSVALPREGWTLNTLSPANAGIAAARTAAAVVAGAWLALVFLALFLQQRWRVARVQQRSRIELEKLVKQHTVALRSTRDELVLTAQDAAHGYRQNLDHLQQGVCIIDAQLRMVAWNRRYAELFRLPADLLRVGRSIEDILRYNARRGLLGSGDAEEAIQRRLAHLRAASPHEFEREWPDGTVLEIHGNPLPDGGFVSSYADITTYKSAARDLRMLAQTLEQRVAQRTAELEDAKHEAENANRAKTRFVNAVVHDLKQPMNAARLYAHALSEREHQRSQPDTVAEDMLASIAHALAAQDAILSSLVDISRLETGTVEPNVRSMPLDSLLDALVREFAMQTKNKGLVLRYVPSRSMVTSDETLLRRILQNLIANAVNYTRHGKVMIGCRRRGESLRIEVWDTGPGIPEHQQREVFEEFRRFDQRTAGTGLGLAIVERSARLLGHDVALRSWPGRGSVFSITVPRAAHETNNASTAPTVSPMVPDDFRSRRIWYIDDDPHVLTASRILLQSWHCDVFCAHDSASALDHAQPHAPPDMVLIDYHLGADFGPSLYEKLCLQWQARPTAILISADADARRALPDASWGFLTKPVRPGALRALMKQLWMRAA